MNTIHEYFGDWIKVINKEKLVQVINTLDKEYKRTTIVPYKSNVFKAFRLCQLKDLNVVVLGQDPYPDIYYTKLRATGIAFGNNSEIPEERWSPSLKTIKDSIMNLVVPNICCTFDPTLESWAKQGILMLNSALTCEVNNIGSHTLIWRPFISTLLTNLSEYYTSIVYILLGKQAKSFEHYIGHNNFILSCNHPAYYARNKESMPSSIFETASKLVEDNFGKKIEWYTRIYT